jgi:hypothetical protein
MTTLEWIAAVVCLTLLAMLVASRMGRRDNRRASPLPKSVHYGHSDVADHEYDDLPRKSSHVVGARP